MEYIFRVLEVPIESEKWFLLQDGKKIMWFLTRIEASEYSIYDELKGDNLMEILDWFMIDYDHIENVMLQTLYAWHCKINTELRVLPPIINNVTLSFTYHNKHNVSFLGFTDKDEINHQPKEISTFYPWIWITDMENIWKKKLKEFVRDWYYHDKPDQFYVDFDWKLK